MARPVRPRSPVDITAPPTPGLADLFWAFLTVSITAFGGAMPWARRTLVQRRRWLRPEEFTDLVALCQFLPGPNVVNLATTVGERFRGLPGAVTALLGLLLLPVIAACGLGAFYIRFGRLEAVHGLFVGIGAAAAGMAAAMAALMARPLVRTRPATTAPIVLAAFVSAGLLGWPVPWVLLGLAPVSIALARRSRL